MFRQPENKKCRFHLIGNGIFVWIGCKPNMILGFKGIVLGFHAIYLLCRVVAPVVWLSRICLGSDEWVDW